MVFHDGAAVAARFYRCVSGACGLRYPAPAGVENHERCPRCGGPVTLVATRAEHARRGTTPNGPPQQPLTVQLLLDNWRSCFNVGAAFRTADGAGVAALHLCGITPTPAGQPKIAKTALGAELAVPWQYHADGVVAATALKRQGLALWALEATEEACSLHDVAAAWTGQPLVLIAGNEVAGVDPGILALCDRVVALPMQGVKRSLNVAIALSVAVYWLMAAQVSKFAPDTNN